MPDEVTRAELESQHEAEGFGGGPALATTKSQRRGAGAGTLMGAVVGAVIGLIAGAIAFGGAAGIAITTISIAVAGAVAGGVMGGITRQADNLDRGLQGGADT